MPGDRCAFVSYRRTDAPDAAGRVVDALAAFMGLPRVFIDIESMAPGAVFPERIKTAIERCDVAFFVVGPAWVTATDANGLRMFDRQDWVRFELRSAIEKNKIVVPLLVNGASMPAADQLPEDVQAFATLNAVTLRHEHFRRDVEDVAIAVGLTNAAIIAQLRTSGIQNAKRRERAGGVEAVMQAAQAGVDSATKLSIGALLGATLMVATDKESRPARPKRTRDPNEPITPDECERAGALFQDFLEDQPWPQNRTRSAMLLLCARDGRILVERIRAGEGDERGVQRLKDGRELASQMAAALWPLHRGVMTWGQERFDRNIRLLSANVANCDTYFHVQAIDGRYSWQEPSWCVALGVSFDGPPWVDRPIWYWQGRKFWTWRHLCDALRDVRRDDSGSSHLNSNYLTGP